MDMTEDREALLAHYRRMRDELMAAIEGLSDDQMTERTLDGWSIKDHLAHIAVWDEIRASEVARISAGHDSAWRMTSEQDEAYNKLTYDLRKDLSLAQVRYELESARERLLAAISSATARGLDASLYGEAPVVSTHQALHAQWIRRWRDERRT
jgi:uncharacterized damage-inducible protein DinB